MTKGWGSGVPGFNYAWQSLSSAARWDAAAALNVISLERERYPK